jgi:hypothetical protein
MWAVRVALVTVLLIAGLIAAALSTLRVQERCSGVPGTPAKRSGTSYTLANPGSSECAWQVEWRY